eukprot:scaffold586_cov155-Amphora_coffeaeformis.AAC.27
MMIRHSDASSCRSVKSSGERAKIYAPRCFLVIRRRCLPSACDDVIDWLASKRAIDLPAAWGVLAIVLELLTAGRRNSFQAQQAKARQNTAVADSLFFTSTLPDIIVFGLAFLLGRSSHHLQQHDWTIRQPRCLVPRRSHYSRQQQRHQNDEQGERSAFENLESQNLRVPEISKNSLE